MASQDVTVKQWTCDACGTEVLSAPKNKQPPSGWSVLTITLGSATGGYTQGVDICPTCGKNPEEAMRAAKARWGQ